MCLNPKKIFRQGKYKESTYKGKKGEEYAIEVFSKCGHCPECVNEKSNNWVIRNYYHAQNCKKACFITLTYKDNPRFLIKKHAQDFMKRLRRYCEYHKLSNNIDMFFCGEYGTLYHRPHYHAIIYNWIDENPKYIGINKKGNIILKSEIIEKCWGFGITTYQFFDIHEIPYIALYNMPQTESKFEYKMKRDKAKELLQELKKKEQNPVHRKVMIYELEKTIKEQEKSKNEYLTFKEFNLWSKGLGWNEFLKGFIKYEDNYDWKEYIEDKIFYTPSPWVKKLANLGFESAIKEMLRRTTELTANGTDEELKAKNRANYYQRTIQDKIKWTKDKNNTIF